MSMVALAGLVGMLAGGIIRSERAREPLEEPVQAVPVVMAAGDIACSPDDPSFRGGTGTPVACRARATSDLAIEASPAAVLALGNLQYGSGSLIDYQISFDRSWGRLRPIMYAVPGEQEKESRDMDVYFAYLGLAAGEPGTGYYSFNLGSWHLVALDTNVAVGPGSAQERWLKADLASSRARCTLAFLHRPRFSSGVYGSDRSTIALWRVLYDFGADIVLAGGDRHYERFKPQTPDGSAGTDHGIREFVVGTGGASHGGIGRPAANSEIVDNDTFGLLRLDLGPVSYDWRFVPEPGKRFTDGGRGTCNAKKAAP
jgi:hypothetical protein